MGSRSLAGRRLIALCGLASAVLTLTLALSARTASATVVYYCGVSGVPIYDRCPYDYPGGSDSPRHTYLSNRGYWGTEVHSGCTVTIDITEFYDSGGALAYSATGCNEAFIYHPGNGSLTRPEVAAETNNVTLTGVAAY
jgi:hypothetical protein